MEQLWEDKKNLRPFFALLAEHPPMTWRLPFRTVYTMDNPLRSELLALGRLTKQSKASSSLAVSLLLGVSSLICAAGSKKSRCVMVLQQLSLLKSLPHSMDNRIENLQLRQGKHGKGVNMICAECGSHNIVAVEL